MSQRHPRNAQRRLPAGHPDREQREADPNSSPKSSSKASRSNLRVPQITMKPKPGSLPPRRNIAQLFMDYLRILFDLKFNQYLTVQLLPLLYVILVIGGLGVFAQWIVDAFAHSTQRGLIYVLVFPIAALVWASACRATTEFLLVVFRMSEDVRTLSQITPTVKKIDAMFAGSNWMSRLLPFIKAFQESRESDANNKSKDPN